MITIRPTHPADAADLYRIISNPQVSKTLLRLPSMEFPETEKWVENGQANRHRLVAEIGGRVVGAADTTHNSRPRLTHSGRIGLMIDPDYWGQGVGSALMGAHIDLADNWLNLYRLELEVFADNDTAVRLYKKHGFTIEGTKRQDVFGGDGRFHDIHVMARLRHPEALRDSPTASPLPTYPTRPAQMVEVEIRPLHPNDLEQLHRLWRDPAVCRTTLQMPSQEISTARQRVENLWPGGHRLVSVVGEQVVGLVTLFQEQNPRAAHGGGLGMMVHPDYWGVGIGSRLMVAILDLADNWLNLRRVALEVNTDNPTAVHLYKKFGFKIEGTKRFHAYGAGRWADSYFMGRMRGELVEA